MTGWGFASISPGGNFLSYYQDRHVHLVNLETGEHRNLTESLSVPFADEDHDYPQPAPGYGYAGWLKDDQAVLVYDKYDIWAFNIDAGKPPYRLTDGNGRARKVQYRVVRLDPDQEFFESGQKLILSAYHDVEKHSIRVTR